MEPRHFGDTGTDLYRTMIRKGWILGSLIGIGVGLIFATAMSFEDWRINPAGIFHDASGTNWKVVVETAISWFVPVTLVASAPSIAVLVWFFGRREQDMDSSRFCSTRGCQL